MRPSREGTKCVDLFFEARRCVDKCQHDAILSSAGPDLRQDLGDIDLSVLAYRRGTVVSKQLSVFNSRRSRNTSTGHTPIYHFEVTLRLFAHGRSQNHLTWKHHPVGSNITEYRLLRLKENELDFHHRKGR